MCTCACEVNYVTLQHTAMLKGDMVLGSMADGRDVDVRVWMTDGSRSTASRTTLAQGSLPPRPSACQQVRPFTAVCLSVCLCMYVCARACVCVCVCVCVFVCTSPLQEFWCDGKRCMSLMPLTVSHAVGSVGVLILVAVLLLS